MPTSSPANGTLSRADPAQAFRCQEASARRSRWRKLLLFRVLPFVFLLMVGFRLYLPTLITSYLNDTLQRNPLYRGRIEAVELSLWRGAYAVHGIHISRTTGAVPVPFITARRLELAIEWRAVLRGEVVGRLALERPELNFVDSSDADQNQKGGDGAWMGLLEDLFPFRINTAEVSDGSVNLRSYDGPVPLHVYLSDLQIVVSNLGNISNETSPLAATVHASALAMDQARCECHIQLDPASYRPTFRLSARLLNLDVALINGFATHYGAIDFERGWFDLVVEADAKEGLMNGYAKPLFRELQVLDLSSDFKAGKILEGIWQGIVSVATFLLKNQDRDQFGTLIPFEGSLGGGTQTDLLALFINILRNAFVEAYLPRFEGRSEEDRVLKFQSPQPWDTTNGIPDP